MTGHTGHTVHNLITHIVYFVQLSKVDRLDARVPDPNSLLKINIINMYIKRLTLDGQVYNFKLCWRLFKDDLQYSQSIKKSRFQSS